MRRLRSIETRRPCFCLGRQVIVFGAERVGHGLPAHIPMVAACDGAERCGAVKAAPCRPELRSVRSTRLRGEGVASPAGVGRGASYLVPRARRVVAGASCDELLTFVALSVALVGVLPYTAVGDDVVALGDPLGPLLGRPAICDEVVEGGL